MDNNNHMSQRAELTRLLDIALNAEQALLCRYLFAAFSMKRTHAEGGVTYAELEIMRRWEARILMIARQEMEHLGLVLNLRTAIGEAPTFEMPAFPFTTTVGDIALSQSLNRMSVQTIIDFALAEMPAKLPESSPNYQFLKERIDGFDPSSIDALADLYQRIRKLVETLPERVLFIGPPAAQFNTHDVFPGSIRGLDISKAPAYNIKLEEIRNRETALAAIDQITAEGEGAHDEGGPNSHFAFFMEIVMQFVELLEKDPDFEPARPVVPNPSLDAPNCKDATQITYEFSRNALMLFEESYETMLLGLTRFFAFPQNDQAEMSALQQAVFFPMMTTIIRPLGEVLTMLPSDNSGSMSTRAGPSFRAPDTFTLTPHKWAAFHMLYMRYERMESMASGLLERIPTLPGDAPSEVISERISFLYQQIYRSRMNLSVNYQKTPDGI